MFLDMSGITDANKNEFYFHSQLYDKLFGAVGISNGEYISIPYATICKAVGLHTNVSQTTRSVFVKKVMANLNRDIKRDIKNSTIDKPA